MTVLLLAAALIPAGHCRTEECWHRVHKRRVAHWVEEHPWRHARAHLSSETKAMLSRLRGCETRGISYPANYRYSGHHHGAYQYTYGTWLRTIPYLPKRLRRHATHGPAYTATPAEQDVRTAYFFPSHRGEWACRACRA